MTYEQWLSLSSDERDRVHFKEWSAYAGDGEHIVLEAGRRLMEENAAIVETSTGIYHGGEWLIHAYVSQENWEHLPKFPYEAQEYAGFRVCYIYDPHPSEDAV